MTDKPIPPATRLLALFYVEWNDSAGTNTGWKRFEDVKDAKWGPSRAQTVGFLLHDNEEAITLTPNMVKHDDDPDGEDDAFDFAMTIPRACITRIVRLAVP